MSAGKGDTTRPINGEKFRDHYDDIFRKDTDDIVCPHCDSNNEPYFSRIEPMGDYCPDCGKERA
jgi:ribosomal protein L37AE/L43A